MENIQNKVTEFSIQRGGDKQDYRKREDRYVNLKANGKLFPSWILKNFNKYKLPEIFLVDEPSMLPPKESILVLILEENSSA